MWTTNFDGLIVRAAHQNRLTPIEINLDNVDRIYRNQSSKELLTIALHGDYKFSTLKNTDEELDTQNETFKDHLSNYHIDKNMIVIGYSGRDKSLMDALKESFTKKGSGRLYWCGYGETINSEVSELLLTIRASGREAYYVATDGFDKTMIHLSKSAFEDNPIISLQIDETLKDISENELHNTDFTLNVTKTDKYIKSNLHPIIFSQRGFSI